MHKIYRLIIASTFFVITACKPLGAISGNVSDCDMKHTVKLADNNVVSALPNQEVMRSLKPNFFGFNLEWVDFQQDMWDSDKSQVKPAVIDWLKPFKGAVYRYPGGTGSNYLSWKDTVGKPASRPVRIHVDWLGPIAPKFGFDEYLNFVESVDGGAWVVLNIYGGQDGEASSTELAKNAADWAAYANDKVNNGKPAVMRWELGNELDRGNTRWLPTKYTKVAERVVKSVKLRQENAQFVGMFQDWPAQKEFSVSEYNSLVMTGLNQLVDEFAHHLYYEEDTWVSVSNRMAVVCQSVQDAKALKKTEAKFWITEHARGLPSLKTPEAWRSSWPKTADLESALIAAETYIAATQLSEVQGLFLHSLGTAHGPWPLFNAVKKVNNPREQLYPSAVYWGLRILRDSMLPNALVSNMQSRNDEKSIGDHDVRSAILTDDKHLQYVVWSVNRAKNSSKLMVKVPALANKKVSATLTFIGNSNKESNNYSQSDSVVPQQYKSELIFDSIGAALSVLPAYSVSAISFVVN